MWKEGAWGYAGLPGNLRLIPLYTKGMIRVVPTDPTLSQDNRAFRGALAANTGITYSGYAGVPKTPGGCPVGKVMTTVHVTVKDSAMTTRLCLWKEGARPGVGMSS